MLTDEVHGMVQFLLVRVRVIDAEVTLVRKELDGNNNVIDQVVVASKQILDGPAYKGDVFPIHLDLASFSSKLTPTLGNINKVFSVRYYIGLVLRDAESRKYYKQVEVMLYRPEQLALYRALPDYKMGLAIQQKDR